MQLPHHGGGVRVQGDLGLGGAVSLHLGGQSSPRFLTWYCSYRSLARIQQEERVVNILSSGGTMVQANSKNIAHINTLLSLIMGGIREIRNRLRTDLNKFESPLGWKLVSGMEKYEGSVGTISRADLRL